MAETRMPSSWTLHLQTANDYGVWTGGANPKEMDSLKTTSFTGGLRFWTDALLRAEGRECCTGQSRCSDGGGGKPVCPTCAIFGCTGLSRAFTVRTETPDFDHVVPKKGNLKVPLGKFVYNNSQGRQKTPSYFLTNGYRGPITLSLSMRRPHNSSFTLPPEVLTALYLMLEYGTFGAYDQYGCGQVNMDADEKKALREACSAWKTEDRPADTGGVTLRDFFFFKGVTEAQNPEAMCEIRHDIRNLLRAPSLPDPVATKLRHWFCGALGNPAQGTNYAYSVDPRTGQIYGWGHFARAGVEFTKFRETAVRAVYDTVRKKCSGNSFVWKEFGSPRDPSSPRDWPGYLASLISTEWRQS